MYFANRERTEDEDAAIYLLSPEELNQTLAKVDGLVSIEEGGIASVLDLRHYHPHFLRQDTDRLPDIAVAPMFSNSRMRAQQSGFILTGDSFLPLDRTEVLNTGVIQKIILPKETFAESAEWLKLAGVGHFGLFPDWEGLRWTFEERQAHLLEEAEAERVRRATKMERS